MPAFDASGEEKVVLDLVKLAGNAVETGTGNAGDGTQRVVLADDQPAVPVTGSFWQATQPVSAASLPLPTGAATAAKQPAPGTAGSASNDVLSIQGVAGMTAVKTDGSGVTQPVSAASLPLPSGAATAAKQPALGTAGSPASDVLSVQGIASMTALKTDGSAVTQPVSLSSPTAIRHEQVSVGTSAVQLTSNAVLTGVNLKADDDNTNSVYIGASGVTTSTGYRLKAGQSVFMAVDNANRLYAIGGAASQKLHVLGS